MPSRQDALRDQAIPIMHELKDRDQSIDRLAATGVGRLEARQAVDDAMAHNLAANRVHSLRGILLGVGGIVFAFVFYLITNAIGRVSIVLAIFAVLAAIGSPLFILFCIYKLMNPSPFYNAKIELDKYAAMQAAKKR